MLPLVIAGLPVGAMYGLAALGLVVVHRATRRIDLSLGAVATAAAFVYHRLSVDASVPAPLAAVIALGVAATIGLVGASVGRVLGPGRPLAGAVASLAIAGLVLAACAALFGSSTEFVAPLLPEVRVDVAGTVLSGHQLLVLGTALTVVAAGGVFLRRSITGLAWNAVAADRVGARVVGLPVRRIETLSSVIAAVLAGGAGVLLAPLLFLDPVQLTVFFLVKPFAAAVVARLHSLPITLSAGLAIGILESLSVRVQSVPGLGETVPFAMMAVALLCRQRPGAREEATAALDRGPSRVPGRGRIWPAAILGLALVLWAPHQSPYQATITQLAGTTALLAATHVVMTGWTGQLSLAQPAFAGIGGIVASRLGAEAGWPLPVTLAAGAVVAAFAAALVGGLTVARGAGGIRFAAVTLACSSAGAGTLFVWAPFAGRPEDRALDAPAIGPLSLAGPRFTWVVITVAALAFWALRRLARSRWGAAMIATREHALAAVALGMPPAAARWAAFTVTGALAGLAGALSAHQLQSVAVEQFHPLTALPLLSAAAVGGLESLWGAVLGAAFLTLAPEALSQWTTPTVAGFVAPAALLITILIRPGGLTSIAFARAAPRRRAGQATRRAQAATTHAGPLVVDRFRVNYGGFVAVDDVDLSVAPGEVVALIGPNGAGKTSVLDAISGFVPLSGGRLVLGGSDLAARPARARAGAGVVRTFQSGGLFPRLTLWENFDVVRRWHRLPPVDDALIAATGLAPYLDRPAGALPHGTARVGEITRALSLRPRVLLLDEPAAGLSRPESEAMISVLRDTAGEAAVLLVEHDQHVVALADRAVVLHLGKVLAAGPPAEALRHPDVVDAYLGGEMHDTPGPTLGEIVAANPAAAGALDRLGLDYCCHGQRSLAEACAAAGLDPAAVSAELEALVVSGDRSWSSMELPDLVDHIVTTHHRYLEAELPLLDALAAKVHSVHGERHPELGQVKTLVAAIRAELEPHIRVEEELIFPAIGGSSTGPDGSLSELLTRMEEEHEQAGDLLAALRRATAAYKVPADACASYRSLFERLEALELDTHLHVLKENHALLPAILRMAP
jgi:iron-sulfur cluster repair di-iron protein